MSPDPTIAHRHEGPLVEGEEPPPPGLKLMAAIRWILLGLAALLALVAWWSYARAEFDAKPTAMQGAQYHCPMHPQIVANAPGECPICHMSLEPITSHRLPVAPATSAPPSDPPPQSSATREVKEPQNPRPAIMQPSTTGGTPANPSPRLTPGATPPGTTPITLTLDRVQLIGVRTAVVGEGNAAHTLRVTAVVAPTEQGATEVHVRSPGFVERILVNQTGGTVRRDQELFTLYSPEILQAQTELLLAQQWTATGPGRSTAESARRKLELLGMSEKDIDRVVTMREPMHSIHVHAPQNGYVIKKNLVAGSYVTPEMTLYEIQDLSHVYVVADVFQPDVGLLKIGSLGRFISTRRPGQAVEVRLDLIYPTLNAEARTTRVRMELKNAKGLNFRPGEYGTVDFEAPGRRAVAVPRDAVIDTGLHTYVFVVLGDGIYSPREVVLGEEQDEMISVLEGVSPGDRVVSGATFLIDSESRLQASAAEASRAAP